MPARALSPYPWELLERLPKAAAREARRVRARVEGCVSLGAVEAALSSVLSCHAMIVVRSVSPAGSWPEDDQAVHLAAADRSMTASLEPEPALASVALARALRRNHPDVARPDARLDPGTQGALTAIGVEILRRASAAVPFRGATAPGSRGPGLRVETTVFLDEQPYALSVWVRDTAAPTSGARESRALAGMGDLPIELLLVAAVSLGSRADVSALRAGDVWLVGTPGWVTVDDLPPAALRVLALSAPNAERGLLVDRSDDGRIVLRGDVVALEADVPSRPPRPATVEDMSEPEDTLQRMAVDAPVVVRVEVGSVTLSAREWAELRPGDVIETGTRLAEPVVLRVAGREVARGELVSVDGELGVRIRELLTPARES